MTNKTSIYILFVAFLVSMVSAQVIVEEGTVFEIEDHDSKLEFKHFNEYPSVTAYSDEVHLGTTTVSISSTGSDEVHTYLHWMDRAADEGEDVLVVETVEGDHGTVNYNFDGIDLDFDTSLESDTSDVTESFTAGEDVSWSHDSWDQNHEFTLVADEDSEDDNGDGGGGTSPSEGYIVTDLDTGAATLTFDIGTDVSVEEQVGTENVLLGNDFESDFAAELVLDFEQDISVDGVDFGVDDSSDVRASYVTGADTVDRLEQVNLIVPRIEDTRDVRVCPEAESIDVIGEDCESGFDVSEDDDSVNGVSVESLTLSEESVYRVSNVSGTGAMELEEDDDEVSGGLPSSDEVDGDVAFNVSDTGASPGSTIYVSFDIWNYVDEENEVTVMVPADDSECSYFEVQESLGSDSYSSMGTYSLELGNESSPSTASAEIKVDIPEQGELDEGSVSCSFSTSSSHGETGDLELTVDVLTDIFDWIRYVIGLIVGGIRGLIPLI